jgi:putative glutamine amidotransferase
MKGAPVIGISCCQRPLEFGNYPPLRHHVVFHKYVDYVTENLRAIPVLLPAAPGVGSGGSWSGLLERLDGVLLTGSPSNVGLRESDCAFHRIEPLGSADHARDEMIIPMIHQCIDLGVPTLGICRGMQEINVALGGDLYDELHALDGVQDHRSDKTLPYHERYLPKHAVKVSGGSILAELLSAAGTRERAFTVNSLHGQGVSTLGRGVYPQAFSMDGVVEAIAVTAAPAFMMGVQWHIEWSVSGQVLDACLTDAFRAACNMVADRRSHR